MVEEHVEVRENLRKSVLSFYHEGPIYIWVAQFNSTK